MNRKANTKKSGIGISEILKRPLVKIVLLVILIIVAVFIIKGMNSNVTKEDPAGLVGYQKLINVQDNKYTYVDLNGKTKVYEGYSSMGDFYYDATCVSKLQEDTGVTQMALIKKNKSEIVKFGVYDNYTQVVGGKYYKVQKDGLYGIIKSNGKVLINPEYNYISVTTVQEAKEVVFECQKDSKYTFINESGKAFYETDVALHSISYANKFNDEYDTIIYISVDGQKKYFNLATGEQLFDGIGDVSVSYNIVKTEDKITFYDKKGKAKLDINVSEDYSADARVYFKKYVVVEQRNVSTGTRAYTYTVYDSDFKKVIESENRINPVEDVDGNVYFIVNESDGVKIINEKKKEVKVEGHEFNGNSSNNLQYIILNPSDDISIYEAYTFKGKKVEDEIVEYSQKGFGLIATKYVDGVSQRSLILKNGTKVALNENDEVFASENYLTIENGRDGYISLVDKEGKVKIDKAVGSKVFFDNGYIGIQNVDNVNIYDSNNGKITFTYAAKDYVNRDETVNIVETTSGFYTFAGKTILDKNK